MSWTCAACPTRAPRSSRPRCGRSSCHEDRRRSGAVDDALTFAFAAGIVAAFNPCGFALLPAYLSFFLGLEGRDGDAPLDRAVPRALQVGATMTVGFVAVFAVMGLVITQVSQAVQQHLKWATIAIGVGLVALGVATIARRQVGLALPKLARGGADRGLWSMLIFGTSYAVASLTCTIAPFLAATSTTFTNDGVAAGVGAFVAYGLGMGVLVTVLTLAVALARGSLVAGFRRAVRFVPVVSGVMLVLAGAYVAYYGIYEFRQSRDVLTRDPVIDRGLDLSADLQSWVDSVGPLRLGAVCAAILGLAIVLSACWRARARQHAARLPERSGAPERPSTAGQEI
ncbi:MAG: cytochrome c biogenesis protein CcdA [Acidimicrobiia bacterium]|nr:cytochrome c biogenesis protein CcdA [Acidimicrobiia bacterium]